MSATPLASSEKRVTAGPTVPALSIRGLRFRYGRAPVPSPADGGALAGAAGWIVDLPALTLEPGAQMLLVGRSGCGKSTLLQLVAGLLDPVEGEVSVAGQRVHALGGGARDRWRGRNIGMIFQTFQLLPGFTALESVMMALHFAGEAPKAQRERASSLLRELGIERLDAPCEELSVGQQQRVAVARAVACRPALVLADEPTASLDPETADTAMDLVQETCRRSGAALLCTSHDPRMERRFDGRALSLFAAHAADVRLDARH